MRHVRRLFHPAVSGRIPRPPRPRTTNMHFGGSGGSGLSSSSSSSSTSARESMDPIAELLSQLSGVRRQAQQPQAPMPMQSQLQLLQQQLQLERQQVQQTRERLERLPARRQMAAAAAAAAASSSAPTTSTVSAQESSSSTSSSFLLARFVKWPDKLLYIVILSQTLLSTVLFTFMALTCIFCDYPYLSVLKFLSFSFTKTKVNSVMKCVCGKFKLCLSIMVKLKKRVEIQLTLCD